MTGDTNMKKENTINQEQEEMVFAEKVFGGAVPKQYFPAVVT